MDIQKMWNEYSNYIDDYNRKIIDKHSEIIDREQEEYLKKLDIYYKEYAIREKEKPVWKRYSIFNDENYMERLGKRPNMPTLIDYNNYSDITINCVNKTIEGCLDYFKKLQNK